MTEPEPVPDPELGAALVLLELADLRLRPWWAAHWVAAGLGGERLAELAGLSGDAREVSDLWPDALLELGVTVPVVRARRTAAPWMARQVVEGRRDVRWLLRELWPYRDHRDDIDDDDEALDAVVYAVDELLDLVERAELARRPPRRRRFRLRPDRAPELSEQQEREWRELADAVVVALAGGGVAAASAVLNAETARRLASG